MPGIAGIVDLDGRFDREERIGDMLRLMKHEPWYKVEEFHQNTIALGRASPGIIDPHSQPVFSQDRSLCLVMYGEVYNYPYYGDRTLKEIYHSNPNNHPLLILRLIEKRGIEVAKYLNGSFVLGLWDFEKNLLTIINDRYGLRPLYYLGQEHLFIFASEMKSILTFPEVKREVDLEAMTQFFSFNFILGDQNLFKQIKILNPSSILTFQNGNLKKETYWSPTLKEDGQGFNKKEALDRTHFLVKQAVGRQLKDDLPKILSLSGGLDSRTILGAIAQLGYKIPTFTFGIPECPDQKLAKAIADAVRMENKFFELSPDFLSKWAKQGVWLTEGMNNCINFHGIEFVPHIQKIASVVLNGFMGGDLFGYLSLTAAQLLFLKNPKNWIGKIFRHINHPFPEYEIASLFQTKYYSQIKNFAFESFAKLMKDSPVESPFNKFYYFRLRELVPKSLLYGLVLDNYLVEYRVPFCDYDLVDFVLTIPPKERALAIFYRHLLSDKFPPLGSISYQRTGLPVRSGLFRILLGKTQDQLKKRLWSTGVDKRRYTDYDHWMRNELKDFLISNLLSERFLSRCYFSPDYVKRMVEQHLSGIQNLSAQLGTLLTFELWNQLFIDQFPNPKCANST